MKIPIFESTPLWKISQLVGKTGLSYIPTEKKGLKGYLVDGLTTEEVLIKWGLKL